MYLSKTYLCHSYIVDSTLNFPLAIQLQYTVPFVQMQIAEVDYKYIFWNNDTLVSALSFDLIIEKSDLYIGLIRLSLCKQEGFKFLILSFSAAMM